jgi:hypothetical protein
MESVREYRNKSVNYTKSQKCWLSSCQLVKDRHSYICSKELLVALLGLSTHIDSIHSTLMFEYGVNNSRFKRMNGKYEYEWPVGATEKTGNEASVRQ